jgi:hypothetical protein
MARRPDRSKVTMAVGQAWRDFHATAEGRAALADLMVWCNAYSPIETNDPIEMARLTGERNVVMRIAALMGTKPSEFLQQAQDDTDILDRMMRSA